MTEYLLVRFRTHTSRDTIDEILREYTHFPFNKRAQTQETYCVTIPREGDIDSCMTQLRGLEKVCQVEKPAKRDLVSPIF